jgi:hypothetical protein
VRKLVSTFGFSHATCTATTRDYRELPGGYGHGSGTLKRWIQEHLDEDAADETPTPEEEEDL